MKVNKSWITGLEAKWNGFWKVSAKLEPTPPYVGGLEGGRGYYRAKSSSFRLGL